MSNKIVRAITLVSLIMGSAGFAVAQSRATHAPTKGRIPAEAFQNGTLNADLVPDYVVAYGHDGEIVGYVRKGDLLSLPKGAVPVNVEVVDEALARTVGRMVPGRGFVASGQAEEDVPEFEQTANP
jgi:hypothetical protein